MSVLREVCRTCGKRYTPEEMAERRQAQRQNALNSRAKAEARGIRVVRKRKVEAAKIRDLRDKGLSTREIAFVCGISISSVSRALRP